MNIPNLNVIRRLWNQKSGVAQRRLALKKEKIEEANMETHRVSVTVTDPHHTMSTMRKEKIEKRVRVKARDQQHAIDSAIQHYKKAGYKVHDHNYIGKVNEELELSEGAYEKAEENKRSADAAKKQGDMYAHHLHMADHHDNMAQWHSEKGRHGEADRHAEKSEKHHEEAMKMKEEVAVNNVGGGNIAGTQGDAGKKPVMTKEPLKRKKLAEFKEWITEAAVDSKGHKSSTGGLTQKGRDYYNNKTGGNLQAPVTTPPSKLDPDSKAAKRRKSFCARMGGMPGPMKDEKGRPTRKALALRKWNC